MRTPALPFERYMSKRILFFAYLMCSSVYGAISNFSEKLYIFEIGLKKYGVFVQKLLSLIKYYERKIRRHVFVLYVLIYPLSKFGGNRTNSLWVLAFYSVRFKWKNWFEKTALNMSIRRVIFTSGQNLKPPFLCQYSIFLRIFYFRWKFILRPIH